MATLQEISEAIQAIESKKQTLKAAFEDLQKQSHSLSSFSLSWPQIDSHFSQIQSSLHSRFSLLQQSQQDPDPQIPLNLGTRSICKNMDAPNLMNWVKNNLNLKDEGLSELGQGLKHAPDPFKLVLDAIEEIHPKEKASEVLFEGLMKLEGANVCEEIRERAKILALKWKVELGDNSVEVMNFLSLLGCYKLVGEFGKDDILEMFHIVSKKAKTIKLCRLLGLEDKVPDIIQKLVNGGKRLMAVRFASEFNSLENFSPVELLQSYLNAVRKTVQQLRKKGNSTPATLDQADVRETNALRTVLRYIRDFKLESGYPPEPLEKQIKQIEELRSIRKKKLPIKSPKVNQKKEKKSSAVNQKKEKKPLIKKVTAVTPGVAIPAKVTTVTPGVPIPVEVTTSNISTTNSQPLLPLGSSSLSYAYSEPTTNASYVNPGNPVYGLAVAYANKPSSSGGVYGPGSQLPSSGYVGPSHLQQPYRPQ